MKGSHRLLALCAYMPMQGLGEDAWSRRQAHLKLVARQRYAERLFHSVDCAMLVSVSMLWALSIPRAPKPVRAVILQALLACKFLGASQTVTATATAHEIRTTRAYAQAHAHPHTYAQTSRPHIKMGKAKASKQKMSLGDFLDNGDGQSQSQAQSQRGGSRQRHRQRP